MVGARQGWIEAPYAPCPAGFAEIAAATVIAPSAALGGVRIVPGVSSVDARGAPDVMRGEETQILGALAAERRGDGVFVLPGTHSKWARVEGGRIVGFRDLHDRRGLRRAEGPHRARPDDGAAVEPTAPTGFALGVDAAAALERPGDLLHAAFMTRTFGLFDQLAAGPARRIPLRPARRRRNPRGRAGRQIGDGDRRARARRALHQRRRPARRGADARAGELRHARADRAAEGRRWEERIAVCSPCEQRPGEA